MVQTQSHAKSSGIKLQKAHSESKGLYLNIQSNKTSHKTCDFKSKRNLTSKAKVRTGESRIKTQKASD